MQQQIIYDRSQHLSEWAVVLVMSLTNINLI